MFAYSTASTLPALMLWLIMLTEGAAFAWPTVVPASAVLAYTVSPTVFTLALVLTVLTKRGAPTGPAIIPALAVLTKSSTNNAKLCPLRAVGPVRLRLGLAWQGQQQ